MIFEKFKITEETQIRIEKYFLVVSITARGRRPKDVFDTKTGNISLSGLSSDLNGK